MLKFFHSPSATPAPRIHRSTAPPGATLGPNDPLPVPEVIEGNEDADWKLWASAVVVQNQMEHKTELGSPRAAFKEPSSAPASIADYVHLRWSRRL